MATCAIRYQQLTTQRAYEVRIDSLGVEAVLEPYRLVRRPAPVVPPVIPLQARRDASSPEPRVVGGL